MPCSKDSRWNPETSSSTVLTSWAHRSGPSSPGYLWLCPSLLAVSCPGSFSGRRQQPLQHLALQRAFGHAGWVP